MRASPQTETWACVSVTHPSSSGPYGCPATLDVTCKCCACLSLSPWRRRPQRARSQRTQHPLPLRERSWPLSTALPPPKGAPGALPHHLAAPAGREPQDPQGHHSCDHLLPHLLRPPPTSLPHSDPCSRLSKTQAERTLGTFPPPNRPSACLNAPREPVLGPRSLPTTEHRAMQLPVQHSRICRLAPCLI